MIPGYRQLHVALKILASKRAGHLPSNQSQVYLIRVGTFTSTSHTQAATSPDVKDMPLFRQLAGNPAAHLAIKEFGQLMKNHGFEFLSGRPPSTIQLVKFMANAEIREGLQKLRDDLEKAGIDVNPENAMEMLEAFKSMVPKGK